MSAAVFPKVLSICLGNKSPVWTNLSLPRLCIYPSKVEISICCFFVSISIRCCSVLTQSSPLWRKAEAGKSSISLLDNFFSHPLSGAHTVIHTRISSPSSLFHHPPPPFLPPLPLVLHPPLFKVNFKEFPFVTTSLFKTRLIKPNSNHYRKFVRFHKIRNPSANQGSHGVRRLRTWRTQYLSLPLFSTEAIVIRSSSLCIRLLDPVLRIPWPIMFLLVTNDPEQIHRMINGRCFWRQIDQLIFLQCVVYRRSC